MVLVISVLSSDSQRCYAVNMAKAKRFRESGGTLQQVGLNSGKPSGVSLISELSNPGEDTEYFDYDTKTGTPKGISKDQYISRGGGSSPTVVSNARILEDTIPNLNSRANGLPTYGAPENDIGMGDDGETTSDDIFGLSGTKKKKKKPDWREGTNFALPSEYWGEMYGADAPQFEALAEMQKTNDLAAREAIRAIRQDFKERTGEQEDINKQATNQIRQALLTAGADTGGSSRYAPLSSVGLLSAQETQGIKVLTALDKQERIAVAEAKAAQQSNDFQLLEKKLNLIDSIRTEKSSAMEGMRGSMMQSQRDNSIAELIAGGVTDPIEILTTLNNAGGDFTIEEITGSLKNLKDSLGGGNSLFSFKPEHVGPLLGVGLTMPDIQAMQEDFATGAPLSDILAGVSPEQQAAVKAALGVAANTSNLTPGVGAKNSDDEYIVRQRLFTSLKNQLFGKNSSDKEGAQLTGMISNLRDLGLSPQQIIDQLTGFTPGIQSPYNQEFANIIRSNVDDPADITSNLNSLSSILNTGDYKKALQKVENVAMKRALELDSEGYLGDTSAKTTLSNARDLKAAVEEAEAFIGPFSGTYQQLLGKLKSGEAAKVKAKITNLYAKFKTDLAGTATTESELRFLEPLIGSITDSDANLKAKIDEMERATLNRLNQTRGSVSLPKVTTWEAIYPAHRLPLYAQDEVFEYDGTNAPQL